MLAFAAALCFIIGSIHSYLGERYILIRLFRKSTLPPIFGSDVFTRRTLRFAWHLTTVAWWGFGCLLLVVSYESYDLRSMVLLVVWGVFFINGAIVLIASKGIHMSWVVFWTIAALVAFVGLSN